MKKIITFFSLVILFNIFYIQDTLAQSTCLPDGNFNVDLAYNTTNGGSYSACPVSVGNNYWNFAAGTETASNLTTICVPYWYGSHGAPVINVDPSCGSYGCEYVVLSSGLNSSNVIGDGIVTNYTFVTGITYNVTIQAGLSWPSTTTAPSFFVYAANSVPYTSGGGWTYNAYPSGYAIPTVSAKQQISMGTLSNSTSFPPVFTQYSATFTATANFSQLWIYLYDANASYGEASLNIEGISICPTTCNSTINYNNGVVPSGFTTYGDINAGSTTGTGGSGTVTISASQNTTFLAAKEVYLDASFNATVNASGSFVAEISPCTSGAVSSSSSSGVVAQNIITGTVMNDRLLIYPNPGNNIANVDFYPSASGAVCIRLTNALGQEVLRVNKNIQDKNMLSHNIIDISHFVKGIYFVEIVSSAGTQTKKLFKS